ncbi:unnamed protein product [Polarella glacialis]|uniref:Transmembrane protein n=1 Tax=Polarella glacialis TaxID=89957 RepID=A0A813DZF8_POLGL|nr:unnamed protein product [Polarella glacialis]
MCAAHASQVVSLVVLGFCSSGFAAPAGPQLGSGQHISAESCGGNQPSMGLEEEDQAMFLQVAHGKESFSESAGGAESRAGPVSPDQSQRISALEHQQDAVIELLTVRKIPEQFLSFYLLAKQNIALNAGAAAGVGRAMLKPKLISDIVPLLLPQLPQQQLMSLQRTKTTVSDRLPAEIQHLGGRVVPDEQQKQQPKLHMLEEGSKSASGGIWILGVTAAAVAAAFVPVLIVVFVLVGLGMLLIEYALPYAMLGLTAAAVASAAG